MQELAHLRDLQAILERFRGSQPHSLVAPAHTAIRDLGVYLKYRGRRGEHRLPRYGSYHGSDDLRPNLESSDRTDADPASNATTALLLPTDTLAFPDLDPGKFDQLLSQLNGTPAVVNFWGSWCTPCREEAPLLAAAAKKHGDRVQFIGVDILDTKGAGRRYVIQFHLPYLSVFDPSPNGDVRSRLGYLGQPDTVFHNAQGVKVSDWEGGISASRLDQGIRAALGAPEPSPSGI